MDKACRLLRDTQAKVADIARETGYNHIPYFTMAFKACLHMTPGEYRARAQRRGA